MDNIIDLKNSKKFKYKIYSISKERNNSNIEDNLNNFGSNGWELISSFIKDDYFMFILKKEA